MYGWIWWLTFLVLHPKASVCWFSVVTLNDLFSGFYVVLCHIWPYILLASFHIVEHFIRLEHYHLCPVIYTQSTNLCNHGYYSAEYGSVIRFVLLWLCSNLISWNVFPLVLYSKWWTFSFFVFSLNVLQVTSLLFAGIHLCFKRFKWVFQLCIPTGLRQ